MLKSEKKETRSSVTIRFDRAPGERKKLAKGKEIVGKKQ